MSEVVRLPPMDPKQTMGEGTERLVTFLNDGRVVLEDRTYWYFEMNTSDLERIWQFWKSFKGKQDE